MSDPSGGNINSSLGLPVEAARRGDYRFFYFTGHRVCNEATVGSHRPLLCNSKGPKDAFPELPKASVLTCLLNCSGSGRLIGINSYQDMCAELPQKNRDGGEIRATVLTWSACDQGQQAGDTSKVNSGFFTRVFAQTVASRIPFPGVSVGEICSEAEELMDEYASHAGLGFR